MTSLPAGIQACRESGSSKNTVQLVIEVGPEFRRRVVQSGVAQVNRDARHGVPRSHILGGIVQVRNRRSRHRSRHRRTVEHGPPGVVISNEHARNRVPQPSPKGARAHAKVAGILVQQRGQGKIADEDGDGGIQLQRAEALAITQPTRTVAAEAVGGGVFQGGRLKCACAQTQRVIGFLRPLLKLFLGGQRFETALVFYYECRDHPEDVPRRARGGRRTMLFFFCFTLGRLPFRLILLAFGQLDSRCGQLACGGVDARRGSFYRKTRPPILAAVFWNSIERRYPRKERCWPATALNQRRWGAWELRRRLAIKPPGRRHENQP